MNNTKVLIIEDDIEMCEELKEALEDENYSVRTVYDGNEASRIIGKEQYDVILLDLKIPGLNGREILKYIKREKLPVKTIVLTGTPLSKKLRQEEAEEERFPYEDSDRYNILGLADAVFNKPFDIEKLISKIKELA